MSSGCIAVALCRCHAPPALGPKTVCKSLALAFATSRSRSTPAACSTPPIGSPDTCVMCLTWSTALASAARQRTREVACCNAASAPSKPCPSRATLPLRDASTIACVPPESAFAARSPSPPSPPVITSAPRSCTGFARPTA
eukprot:scaffold72143_cov75-Phaeocystis_antarctica.AAC.4